MCYSQIFINTLRAHDVPLRMDEMCRFPTPREGNTSLLRSVKKSRPRRLNEHPPPAPQTHRPSLIGRNSVSHPCRCDWQVFRQIAVRSEDNIWLVIGWRVWTILMATRIVRRLHETERNFSDSRQVFFRSFRLKFTGGNIAIGVNLTAGYDSVLLFWMLR